MSNKQINSRDQDHIEENTAIQSFSSQLMHKLGFGKKEEKMKISEEDEMHYDSKMVLNNPASFKVTARSERGPRNQRNEDAYLVLPDMGIFAVSDGMGGHNGGRVASRLTISTLYEGLTKHGIPIQEESISSLIDKANQRVYEHSRSNLNLKGMGCTLVLAWIKDTHLTLFNIGDSRAYRLKDYNLEQLTSDHAKNTNDLGHAIAVPIKQRGLTRALGVKPKVRVDITKCDWSSGDMLMLSSDGITDVLQQYQLANILVEHSNLAETVNTIITSAISAGGDDDKTVLLVHG